MEFDYSRQPGLTNWHKNRVNTQPPLVSVITPYYNGGKHIRQTYNCVVDQTFPWFEWIIVNDGSTIQEDVELLRELETLDPRIRVLHKKNGGISSARNHGIRHARTDLILPLDGDDLLEPTFIEYCWWMLQKSPTAAWAYTDCAGFQGQEYLWHKPFDPLEMKRENLLTATALIRKEVLLSVGGYAEVHKHYNEDWYAWLNIIARGGYPAQSSGEYLFWYRRNDTGVLSRVKTDKEIVRKNRELIASAAADIQDPAPGILYPSPLSGERKYPCLSSWGKSVYDNKNKKHILFLLSGLEAGPESQRYLELISGLDAETFDTGIITTDRGSQEWLQRFRQLTPDIFNLANFMDPADYGEFISYYLISRQVDCIAVSDSGLGYWLLPWIRQHFPEITIVGIDASSDDGCAAGVAAVVEKTYDLAMQDAAAQFAADAHWMITDTCLLAQRHTRSEALQSCSPLAAELYAVQTQLQSREEIRKYQEEQKLLNRIRKTAQEVGLRGLIRKLFRRILRLY